MEDMEIDQDLTPSFTVSTPHATDNLRTEDESIPSMSQAKNNMLIDVQPSALKNRIIEDKASSMSQAKYYIEPDVRPSMSQDIKHRILKVKPIAFTPQAQAYAIIEDEPPSASAVHTPIIKATEVRPVCSISQDIKKKVLKVNHVTSTPQTKAIAAIEDKPTYAPAVYNWITEQMGGSLFQSQKTRKTAVDGWSKEEKLLLYVGLKTKHNGRLEEIQDSMPHKTKKEIEAAIAYYRERASDHPDCTLRKLKIRKAKSKPFIPLAAWAKVLTEHLSFNELQTEAANAFRLIADLEDIPPPACTENIDFQMVYHQIADAMEGKVLVDNRLVAETLNSCVLDAILVGKSFIKPSSFKQVINSVNFKEKEVPYFPRPTKDNELAIIRHFCALRNYNPLGITEENLTPPVNGLLQKVHNTEENIEKGKEM